MGRLVALILGGIALVLYVPPLLGDVGVKVQDALQDVLTQDVYHKLTNQGAGVFAGIALLLLATRGRE